MRWVVGWGAQEARARDRRGRGTRGLRKTQRGTEIPLHTEAAVPIRRTDTARLSGAPYRYPVARKQFAVPSVATGGVVAPRSASQSACGGACGISVAESAVEAVSERDGNRRVLSLAFSRASFSFTFLQLPSVLTCMSFPRFNSVIFSFFFQVWASGSWLLPLQALPRNRQRNMERVKVRRKTSAAARLAKQDGRDARQMNGGSYVHIQAHFRC